ncbi:MAG: GNAT family N-acetyltransferase [Aeromicrobium sp.]
MQGDAPAHPAHGSPAGHHARRDRPRRRCAGRGRQLSARPATTADLEPLADLAARTFPLAAPDDATTESLAQFIEENLSAARFAEHLADPACDVLVHDSASNKGSIDGYVLLVAGEPDDPDVVAALTIKPTIMLSKFYVAPDAHGQGLADQLMVATLAAAEARGAASLWLGVNQENARAQRFYARQGFDQVGTKRFQVGDRLEHDFVLQRALRRR